MIEIQEKKNVVPWIVKCWRFFIRPKKRIYFVRHGETILNAAHIRQGNLGGLSEKGKLQAQFAGERLKSFPIEVVLVSPFERTQETALIINSSVNKPIELLDLLTERKNPKEIIGKSADDPEVRLIVDRIDKSFHDSSLRFSDEENYEDLRLRAEKLLDYLEKRPEKDILCITHGIFLTMVIAVMEFRAKLTPIEYVKITYQYSPNNAGITFCEYSPWKWYTFTHGWEMVAWNDYTRI
jgi:probable phosphoglycerate mutase